MNEVDDSEVHGRKRVGRPRVDHKAEPISRTVRIPLQMYDELTTYLEWQIGRSGSAIDRSELLHNIWIDYREKHETVNWSKITGRRRIILIELVAFLAHTAEDRPEAEVIDSMLVSMDLAVRVAKRLQRMLKLRK